MATPSQYYSFALIAYKAIQIQLNNVKAKVEAGCDCGAVNELLFVAQNMTDTVKEWGLNCVSYPGVTENDIESICNWLTLNLKFSTAPINTL